MFTASEKKIIKQIRREIFRGKEYNFWFIYDDNGNAIGYEGGSELPKYLHFRNTYALPAGLYKRVVKVH